MLSIKNYIKINESLYELNQITKNDLTEIDWEYIEGAIEISFNNRILIGKEICDDINWFWGYVAYNFHNFFEENIYTIGYPSQPITFNLSQVSSKSVKLEIYDRNQIYVAKELPRTDFLQKFLIEAKNYFVFEKQYLANEKLLDALQQIKMIEHLIQKIE